MVSSIESRLRKIECNAQERERMPLGPEGQKRTLLVRLRLIRQAVETTGETERCAELDREIEDIEANRQDHLFCFEVGSLTGDELAKQRLDALRKQLGR